MSSDKTKGASHEEPPFYETLAVTAAHYIEQRHSNDKTAKDIARTAFFAAVYFSNHIAWEEGRPDTILEIYCDGITRGNERVLHERRASIPPATSPEWDHDKVTDITRLAVRSVCQARMKHDTKKERYLIGYFHDESIGPKEYRDQALSEALASGEIIPPKYK